MSTQPESTTAADPQRREASVPLVRSAKTGSQQLRSLTLAALALVLMLAAAGCGRSSASETPAPVAQATPTTAPEQRATTTTVVRPTEPVDQLVPVGGAKMHATCTGHGDVTVLLLSGFTDPGDSWTKVVPAVSPKARVCSYSRFGLGTSDAPPTPQTFASQAKDLRAALDAMHEPGPFVVVGHSFGGAEAVTFTAQNQADVRGLLLVDASPPAWHDASCAVPDDGTAKAQEFKLSCTMAHAPANNPERLDGPAAFAGVASIQSLGNVPMIVSTRARASYPGLAAAQEERLRQVWDAGQQHWMSLSTSSRLVPVENTGHVIQMDRPDVVIDAIDHLLTGRA